MSEDNFSAHNIALFLQENPASSAITPIFSPSFVYRIQTKPAPSRWASARS